MTHTLYPELEPYQTYTMDVGGGHRLYVEECGNPSGNPVIFLHGGPGAGCNERHRRYFNPDKYRIVIFDQRGAARSAPAGYTEQNTTQHLLADIEQIRTSLDIERWLVFGGSWGAALGLLYAEQYPHRVSGMILRGTFLARQCDVDWFRGDGAGRLLPDYWEQFSEAIPEAERHDLISAYYRRIHGNDKQQRLAAAREWSIWGGRVVTYLMVTGGLEAMDDEAILNEAAIETHYAKHRYFIEGNQILRGSKKLPDVPIKIIHGRRDLTCTLDASWALHKAVPQSELEIVANGGHLAGEEVMIDALVRATDDMADKLK